MVAWEELEKAGTTWADLSGVTWAELEETCEKGSSNIAQKDLEDRDGEYPIYGASGFIKNVDFYQQETPYIAVVKDGAGVGRVMRLPAKSSVIGTMQYILPKNNVDTGYLAYALEHMNLSKYYTGATIPHIYFKDYNLHYVHLICDDVSTVILCHLLYCNIFKTAMQFKINARIFCKEKSFIAFLVPIIEGR